MVAIVSEGTLKTLHSPTAPPVARLQLADGVTQAYAEIWRTQPAVRTVVSFLARNIAQLGLPAFDRVGDTDRSKLDASHPLVRLLGRPTPRTTRYAWVNAMVHDLGIYDISYHVKIGRPAGALLRVPVSMVTPKGESWLEPDYWEIKGSKGTTEVGPEQMLCIHGYNPDDSRVGSSSIESLRRTLSEEFEAGRMREQSLRNGARVSGYLKRPPTSQPWSDDAKERFRAGWRAQYAGNGPEAGGTPILEDGMDFIAASTSPKDLQYIESRKLSREEVAAAYFIPPPMVGILDHATFSNIQEQHKQLYQDTLGPWLEQLQAEIELQLVPDFDSSGRIYVEFNLAEKLKGTPEEQAKNLQTAVGAPWVTRNEARAMQNRGPIEGGDELIVPLNLAPATDAAAAVDEQEETNAD